jgi:excisionase family DNA binding protein
VHRTTPYIRTVVTAHIGGKHVVKKRPIERPTSPPNMGVKDAAEYLNVHPDLVRGMIARGELPAYRAGRLIRLRREDIDAAIRMGA